MLLCTIPFVNGLAILVALDTYACIYSLARYLYSLGFEFVEGSPVWRWELWRRSRKDSPRSLEGLLFGASFLLALGLSCLATWFAHPASEKSWSMRLYWAASSGFTLFVGIFGVWTALRIRKTFISVPGTRWGDLWPARPQDREPPGPSSKS